MFIQVATVIAVYANWEFARIKGIGWGWAGVIWIYSIITYFPLDILKFIIGLALSGKAWDSMIQNKTAFTTKKDYGKGEREAQWAVAQRTLRGLSTASDSDKDHIEISAIAEQARRRAEVARYLLLEHITVYDFFNPVTFIIITFLFYRLREIHTLKGHVESMVKLKGLDIETIQQHYTV